MDTRSGTEIRAERSKSEAQRDRERTGKRAKCANVVDSLGRREEDYLVNSRPSPKQRTRGEGDARAAVVLLYTGRQVFAGEG